MTTIILIIIGILLAAAAALMVIFYGGDAFNSGTVGAQANQVINAGNNIMSAAQLYRAENGHPIEEIEDLLSASGPSGAFLDEVPVILDGREQDGMLLYQPATGQDVYGIPDIPADICSRINADLGITLVNGRLPGVVPGTGSFPRLGCSPARGATGRSIFFIKI